MSRYLLACMPCLGNHCAVANQPDNTFDPAANTYLADDFNDRMAWVSAHTTEHDHTPSDIEIMIVPDPEPETPPEG